MEGKVCSKCGEWKKYSEYHRHSQLKDGYRPRCKKCRKKERILYHTKNKEKTNEKAREYYYKNKEACLESCRNYRDYNKETIRQKARLKRQLNKDYYNERGRIYYQNNRAFVLEKCRKYSQTEEGKETSYRARMKRRSNKHSVDFTPHRRLELLDRDRWTCQECNKWVHDVRKRIELMTYEELSHKATIDHIYPISLGGSSDLDNLQILCWSCNTSKGNRVPQKSA